jgi:putative membrane protein
MVQTIFIGERPPLLPLLLGLGLLGALYGRGLAALWGRAGRGRGVRAWRAAAFGGGLLVLLAALAMPLSALFATHMAQHALISLVAAPLLVLGLPMIPLAWAMPAPWRRRLPTLLAPLRRPWAALSALPVACTLYAGVFWLWHVPGLYEAALHRSGLHGLAHSSFLATALLFWWAVGLGGGRRPSGASLAALFVIGVQNSALSALIISAPAPWFADHARNALLCNLAPLEDQQLAGLIMMLPCDLIYLMAALGLGYLWLRDNERRARRAELSPAAGRIASP